MADDDKIIQEIEIDGADAAVESFTKIGDGAEAGLGKIDKAAATASIALERFSTQLDATTKKTSESSKTAGDGATGLGKLESAASQLGASLKEVGSSVGEFVTRLAVIGGASAAAVGGVVLFAKSLNDQLTKLDDNTKSSRELRQEVKAGNAVFNEQQIKAVSNARAFSELNYQMAMGKISLHDWFTQSQELHRTQKNEAEDMIRVAHIQEEQTKARLEEIKALEKEQEKRKIMNDLIKKFGSDLTSSLLRLGNTADDFWREFTSGPSMFARVVDTINQVLEKTGSKLIEFYNRIGTAFAKALNFKSGQKGIDEFSERLVAFGEEVTTIFEHVIGPAVKFVINIARTMAEAFNGIFGTNVSAGGVIFVSVLFTIAGGFKILLPLLGLARAAFGLLTLSALPWLIIIGLITAALYLLITRVDWKAFASKAQDAARAIAKAWDDFKQFFVDLWAGTVKTASDAWGWIKQKAADARQYIVDKWNGMLQFFDDIWNGLKQGAADAWQFVQTRAQEFVDWFKTTWLWKFVGSIQEAIAWIGKLFAAKQQALSKGDSSSGDGSEGFAGGGAVRGPGTSTSDSILARLSTGEFVMKAAAVQRYGIAWMQSINQMRVPKFNMGGLVGDLASALSGPMVMPAFAGGGHVSQSGTGRPIVLNIGGESFNLLTRDGETAENLGRFANKRRMTSTGRKPSHWGA